MCAEQSIGQDGAATVSLYQPLRLGGIELRNRLVVAPMTRVSANEDGQASAAMASYYAAFAEGGFGLVLTEGIYTDQAWSQGYLFQPGLANKAQGAAWQAVTQQVHAAGSCIVAQLMHAGALSQDNRFRSDTRGPSAAEPAGRQMIFYRGNGAYPVPVAMTDHEIDEVIAGFAAAARRAREAGFDGVEIHGANGYLLDQFLSEGINRREDRYGGNVENRLRLQPKSVGR